MKLVFSSLVSLLSTFLFLGIALRQEPEGPFLPPPPALPRESLVQRACQGKMFNALTAQPPAGLTYLETDASGSRSGEWRFEGITGEQAKRQVDQRGGPVFDLVKINIGAGEFLWAAAGVTIPPYYFVHDPASLEQYKLQGHGSQPYYLSFISGLETGEQIREAFGTPGAYRVSLSLSGPHVWRSGVEWEACLPEGSDACLAGTFIDRLMLSGNQTLIEFGYGSRSSLYGFITFHIDLLERLDLCPAQ